MNQEPEFDPTLESNLREVTPAEMDTSLAERIELAVNEPSGNTTATRPAWNWQFWFIPGTAVAAVTLTLILNPSQTDPAPTPQTPMAATTPAKPSEDEPIELFPVRHNNMVTHNEGVIHLTDNQPFRRIRMQMVDSFTWEDPTGPTRVQYTVPREEHLLIPVDVH